MPGELIETWIALGGCAPGYARNRIKYYWVNAKLCWGNDY